MSKFVYTSVERARVDQRLIELHASLALITWPLWSVTLTPDTDMITNTSRGLSPLVFYNDKEQRSVIPVTAAVLTDELRIARC